MSAERKLVGHDNFVRHNPHSDKFEVKKFHHIEWYTSDASNTSRRFTWGVGMMQVAKSDMSTGNKAFASVVCQSNDVKFVFTAPYNNPNDQEGSEPAHPAYNQTEAHRMITDHGLFARAIGIIVSDARIAHDTAVANGAVSVLPPHDLVDKETGKTMTISEIKLFGDGVLRWMSGDFDGPYLPNYANMDGPKFDYGIQRIDHIVNNVPNLFEATDYLQACTGFHEFSEFTAEDVGTVDSGLNSMVLANNSEHVLLPVNEPTFGTKRKSQIQTYLEHNNGAGVQHIALKTNDIFKTMRELRSRSFIGGFEFMPAPNDIYYERCPDRIGRDVLTPEQWVELKELGVLADRDDQGVLLQVFTKPLGDRMTAFVEIIQRIGCTKDDKGQDIEQIAGCGGFGKGNFSELFKSIEEYEKTLESQGKK
jgi:4-hydroxyphenylpyruvate dioxygenase